MFTKVPTFTGKVRPATYHWIGTKASDLFWDDPGNWAEGIVPNHPEATVVFADALDKNVNVILQSDVFLANLWFCEKQHTYTILPAAESSQSSLIFQTGQQLSNITIDQENKANHIIKARIIHSCEKFWSRPLSWEKDAVPPSSFTKLLVQGDIESYKDAPRASVNLDGFFELVLSGKNTFIGPIIVSRGILTIATSEAIPQRSSLSVTAPGLILLADNVEINLGRLVVEGQTMPPGKYITFEASEHLREKVTASKPEGVSLTRLKSTSIIGEGVINVLN